MIHDSGKMAVLDKLLVTLKREGHRVLIYSQMTRMIDLLEEFMAYRRYKYIRLDGSSRISDRRDMVDDFQTKWVPQLCSWNASLFDLLSHELGPDLICNFQRSWRWPPISVFFVRSDIFVFLLSTRAGGLGINLTAADTVSRQNSDKRSLLLSGTLRACSVCTGDILWQWLEPNSGPTGDC